MQGRTQQLDEWLTICRSRFSILGWHEIEAVADKADARIGLLDRIGNAAEIRTIYGDIRAQIERCAISCLVFQQQVKKLGQGPREHSGIFRASERR